MPRPIEISQLFYEEKPAEINSAGFPSSSSWKGVWT